MGWIGNPRRDSADISSQLSCRNRIARPACIRGNMWILSNHSNPTSQEILLKHLTEENEGVASGWTNTVFVCMSGLLRAKSLDS
jgi:hypothetical protein